MGLGELFRWDWGELLQVGLGCVAQVGQVKLALVDGMSSVELGRPVGDTWLALLKQRLWAALCWGRGEPRVRGPCSS